MQNKYKEETTKPCPNTILNRIGNDYFERNRRRKNLPARWWSRQESDRSVFRGIEGAKEFILPLDLGEYRFCLRGGCRFVRLEGTYGY